MTAPSFDKLYDRRIADLRRSDFPALTDTIYLDNAGIAPCAGSVVRQFADTVAGQLFGNPHSYSAASQRSTNLIDAVRVRLLDQFKADPDDFDIVFVANATAAIKLVADGLSTSRSDPDHPFTFLYHVESHTSVVGVRQLATTHTCFTSDDAVEEWISSDCGLQSPSPAALFAYPAQSNLTGRRLPLSWAGRVRKCRHPASDGHHDHQGGIYTLVDASALVSSCQLDLSRPDESADFIAFSLHKMYGFPDLGALIVRKSSGNALVQRRYFGGGTVEHVDPISCSLSQPKQGPLHSRLEDGTLPIHSIVALGIAIDGHIRLFGSFSQISQHTGSLADVLSRGLAARTHGNGRPVAEIYSNQPHLDPAKQGPIVAFNLLAPDGSVVGLAEVEKMAAIRNVAIRTGTMCNPGGLWLIVGPDQYRLAGQFAAAVGCRRHDGEAWAGDGRALGVVRASVGAANTMADITAFLSWIDEFFVVAAEENKDETVSGPCVQPAGPTASFCIDELVVYPIKSCAGFVIPHSTSWPILSAGLAYDREWCLVHDSTGEAMSLKKHPLMAHIHPHIDLRFGLLHIEVKKPDGTVQAKTSVQLDSDSSQTSGLARPGKRRSSWVCGDLVDTLTYSDSRISRFFSDFLNVPCHLARMSSAPSSTSSQLRQPSPVSPSLSSFSSASLSSSSSSLSSLPSQRGWKGPDGKGESDQMNFRPIRLSNESPILVVNQASVNHLHSRMIQMHSQPDGQTECNSPLAAARRIPTRNRVAVPRTAATLPSEAEMVRRFRPNIVIRPTSPFSSGAYNEENWLSSDGAPLSQLAVTRPGPADAARSDSKESPIPVLLSVLGPCRRCQIVCVDSTTACRDPDGEPFATLAKTRRKTAAGNRHPAAAVSVPGVTFGIHCGLDHHFVPGQGQGRHQSTIRVGDQITILPAQQPASIPA